MFRKKPSILLTINPIDDKSNDKIISSVGKSLKNLNLTENFIIELHPSENGLLHQRICQKLEINPIIIKNYDILKIIKSADHLLSQKSTT